MSFYSGHANSTLINNQATSSPVFSTKTTSPIGPINGANYSAIGNKYNNVGIGASSSQSSSPMQGGPTTYYYSSSSVPPSPSDPKQQAQSHPPQQHYRTTTTTIRSSGSTGPSKDVPDQHQPQRGNQLIKLIIKQFSSRPEKIKPIIGSI